MFVDIIFLLGFCLGFALAFYIRNRGLGKKIDDVLEQMKRAN